MTMNVLRLFHEPVHDSYSRIRYNWKSDSDKRNYEDCVAELFGSSELDYSDVNRAYDNILNCITKASEAKLSKREFKPFLKPYWSNELKLVHAQMRRERIIWKRDGKPRTNTAGSYTRYKDT